MFKKAILASAILAASSGLAFANGGTIQPAPHATHSAYVGVAVSRDFFHVKDNNEYIGNVDLGNDGWDGELNAGIGWVFQDHYYLGGEIFGTINSAKINISAPGFNKNVRYKYSYGIDLVPGVKISDSTMLYGKVGYVRGEFRETTGRTNGRNGLQLGIGMETLITNNISTKIEYDWNYYDKFSSSRNIRPTVDSVKLGVAYHFMSA